MFSTLVLCLSFVTANLLVMSHFTLVLGSLAATHLLVTHVGPCGDASGMQITFDELVIATQTVDSSLTGLINMTQDIDNGWKLKATMQKCADIRNVETCDFLNEFYVVTDGCADENDSEEETYDMLFHYARPEMACPIKAGVYKLQNYPIFTEDNFLTVHETKISTSLFGYKFNLNGFTVQGQRIFCVEAYLELRYMREHNWLSAHNKSQEKRYKNTNKEQSEN